MDIKDALRSLNTENEEHWTGDGSARIDVIKELVGGNISRQDIIDAAPDFNRESAKEPDTLLMNAPEDKGDEDDETDEQEIVDPEQEIVDDEIMAMMKSLIGNASSTPTKFIQELSNLPTEGLQELDGKMVERYNSSMKYMELAKQDMKQLQVNMHSVRSRLRHEVPDMSNQEAIQTFIRKQNETRAQKAETRSALLGGITAKDLDPRAPIDQAFSRKNKRGTARPVAPQR